jgi:hypothetical protein
VSIVSSVGRFVVCAPNCSASERVSEMEMELKEIPAKGGAKKIVVCVVDLVLTYNTRE